MEHEKPKTGLSCESLNSNLDNTWQAYLQSTAMHAKDTPESKANMLTQFPWIASEVFLGVCCQTNSMILSLLFLILVFPFSLPPSFTLWHAKTPVAVICCFICMSSKLA